MRCHWIPGWKDTSSDESVGRTEHVLEKNGWFEDIMNRYEQISSEDETPLNTMSVWSKLHAGDLLWLDLGCWMCGSPGNRLFGWTAFHLEINGLLKVCMDVYWLTGSFRILEPLVIGVYLLNFIDWWVVPIDVDEGLWLMVFLKTHLNLVDLVSWGWLWRRPPRSGIPGWPLSDGNFLHGNSHSDSVEGGTSHWFITIHWFGFMRFNYSIGLLLNLNWLNYWISDWNIQSMRFWAIVQ